MEAFAATMKSMLTDIYNCSFTHRHKVSFQRGRYVIPWLYYGMETSQTFYCLNPMETVTIFELWFSFVLAKHLDPTFRKCYVMTVTTLSRLSRSSLGYCNLKHRNANYLVLQQFWSCTACLLQLGFESGTISIHPTSYVLFTLAFPTKAGNP